jgi:hypothetical protein
MQVRLFPSGLIDELFVTASGVQIGRTGDAQYTLAVSLTEGTVDVAIWTTRKSRIRIAYADPFPEWINIENGIGGELELLTASSCEFHLEHCDRHFYSMTFLRPETALWSADIVAERYIKASFVGG